jgi:hypothetical protein
MDTVMDVSFVVVARIDRHVVLERCEPSPKEMVHNSNWVSLSSS